MKTVKNILCFLFLVPTVLLFSAAASYGAEHQHDFKELYTAKATCTEKAFTVLYCDCGETDKQITGEALGHNCSEDRVCFKRSTCTEKGEEGRYCLRCYAVTDVVYYKKTSHTPETVVKKATLKRNGEEKKVCSGCDKLYSSKKISKIASVKLEKKVYTYDGKVKTPDVTVKASDGRVLKKDRDYTLKYQKGRKKTGEYSVTITFIGNYEGTKTLRFTIRPTKVKSLSATPSVTSVNLSWKKSKGADGYDIFIKSDKTKLIKSTEKLTSVISKIDGKKLKSGTDYTFVVKSYKKSGNTKIYSSSVKIKVTTKPQKASIRSLTASSGSITLKAAKQSCHGYEVLLSTNKSFSNVERVKVKSKGALTYRFENLTKGKKYYIKIRAYVVSGGEKFCGYYSDVKSIKA